jgi:hypothetical protein
MSESSKQSSEFESVKYEEARVRVRPLPEVEGHFFAADPENFAGAPENFAGGPENFAGAPENFAGAPENFTGGPENFAADSNAS